MLLVAALAGIRRARTLVHRQTWLVARVGGLLENGRGRCTRTVHLQPGQHQTPLGSQGEIQRGPRAPKRAAGRLWIWVKKQSAGRFSNGMKLLRQRKWKIYIFCCLDPRTSARKCCGSGGVLNGAQQTLSRLGMGLEGLAARCFGARRHKIRLVFSSLVAHGLSQGRPLFIIILVKKLRQLNFRGCAIFITPHP